METKSIYNKYSIDQLIEFKNDLDAEEFSDKILEIDQVISKKLENPSIKADFEKKQFSGMYATLSERIKACILDGVVISILFSIILSALNLIMLPILKNLDVADFSYITVVISIVFSVVIPCGYLVVMHYYSGQTLGKKMLKIKVVRCEDEKPISLKSAYFRDGLIPTIFMLIMIIAMFFLIMNTKKDILEMGLVFFILVNLLLSFNYFLKAMTVITNKKRRSLYDYLGGTVVIKIDL